MQNSFTRPILAALLLFASVGVVQAHFGMIIPSDTMVMPNENHTVSLKFSFSHPFEGQGMDLAEPEICRIYAHGKTTDLRKALRPDQTMGHASWSADFTVRRPGVYMVCMEPKPYWEPAEDVFIIHYTKTVIAAFGDDEGWDQEIGLKTEIVPLSKPFSLYTGNVFQGIVKLNGKPVSFAEVEVEYYNEDQQAKAPSDYMITQTVKADANGIFTYAVPHAGWWGFAALNEADYTIKQSGKEKAVELGAVLWVKFHDWQVRTSNR